MIATPTETTTHDQRLDEVIAAYLAAIRAGESADPQDWLARYPDIATDLAAFFADRQHVTRATQPLRDIITAVHSPSREGEVPHEPSSSNLKFKIENPKSSFGPYDLLEEIGRGGMGIVYKARQTLPRRIVALKMIRAGHLASLSDVDRFRAEAEAAASLDHPHIVPIYEVGQHAGHHYFTMKLIEGGSLAERNSEFRIQNSEFRSSATLLATVARAIHYAHQHGILHRDLKPANILLDADNHPYITDFGLAKIIAADRSTTGSTATLSGLIVGTASYMAPEQAAGTKTITTAADIYSLGAIFYELLTGRPPFQAATPFETLIQLRDRDPAPPRSFNPQIDSDLETICLKCLEKDPSRRYGSAELLAQDLDRWLAGDPIAARPISTIERTLRRCRRHPLTAFLGAAVILVAALGLIGILTQWQAALASEQKAVVSEQKAVANEQKAESQAAAAKEQAIEAATQRDEAQRQRDEIKFLNEKLGRTLYLAHINLAQHAWATGDLDRTRNLLDQYVPTAGGTDLRGFEWHYLDRLCHPDVFRLKGHTGAIICVAYSPDGRRLASGGSDKTLKVWDAKSGQELLSLTANSDINALDFSPDGKRVAAVSTKWEEGNDDELPGGGFVWDIETGKQLYQWSDSALGYAIAYSPNGKQIASGSGSELKLRDAETGREQLSLKALSGQIHSVTFSPDGKTIACVGVADRKEDGQRPLGEIKIFDAETGRQLAQIHGHTAMVRCAAFSPDGNRLATASRDATIKVWNIADGTELLKLSPPRGGSSETFGIAFSPDGKYLATNAADRTVRLWDAKTGEEQFAYSGVGGRFVNVAFSPDGNRLVCARQDQVTVWNTRSGQLPQTFSGHGGGVMDAVLSPDGTRVATASSDSSAKIWDARTGDEIVTLMGHTASVRRLAFSPDGNQVATAGNDNLVKLWDVSSGRELRTLAGHSLGVLSVAFSPDGNRLATSSHDTTVKIWNLRDGSELLTISGHSGPVGRVAYSPDAKRLVTASMDHTVRIWDAATGAELMKLEGHDELVREAFFSPDGSRIVSGSANVIVWSAITSEKLLVLPRDPRLVWSVALSPDGKRIATGSDQVRIWDANDGQELLLLRGHTGNISSVAFSQDGTRLISASTDKTARIWDATPLTNRVTRKVLERITFPAKWGLTGQDRDVFEMGIDRKMVHGGQASCFLRPKDDGADAWAATVQIASAEPYRGKRLRMSAFVKTENAESGASLWLRIDSVNKSLLDNMWPRRIKGTTEWTQYECVLDVAEDAVNLVYGLGFGGNGQAWVDDFQFEIVGDEVKITGTSAAQDLAQKPIPSSAAPTNLDFEK